MSTPITLLKSFATGQGAGVSNYFTYATDFDANFIALETVVNALVQEVSGLQGPDAGLARTVLEQNDAAGSPNTQGVIGQHSYKTTIDGGTPANLLVEAGDAMLAGTVVSLASQATLVGTGSGPTGTRWVAIDATGTPSLEVLALQQSLDIASVTWNNGSGQFTGAVTQLAEILFDGDDYDLCLDRPAVGDATTRTFPATDFRNLSNRIGEIERLLAGIQTQLEGSTALGAIAFGGGPTAPGLILSDGSTYETDSGLFRAAADVLGVTIAGNELLRFLATAVLANANGSVGNPFWSWVADPDSGMYRIGTNDLGWATNGVLGFELTAQQQVDSPTQFRVRGSRTATQSINNAVTTNVQFTAADEYDIGTWHNEGGGAPGNEEFTVPTGGTRLYAISAKGTWATNSTGYRQMDITVGGTAVGSIKHPTAATGTTPQSVSAILELTAGQVVRLAVTQNSGGALNISDCRLSIVALW